MPLEPQTNKNILLVPVLDRMVIPDGDKVEFWPYFPEEEAEQLYYLFFTDGTNPPPGPEGPFTVAELNARFTEPVQPVILGYYYKVDDVNSPWYFVADHRDRNYRTITERYQSLVKRMEETPNRLKRLQEQIKRGKKAEQQKVEIKEVRVVDWDATFRMFKWLIGLQIVLTVIFQIGARL